MTRGCQNPAMREAVKTLAMQGLTIRQMADQLGISFARVNHYRGSLMNAGEIKPAAARKPRQIVKDERARSRAGKRAVRLKHGTMGQLVKQMQPEHVAWLTTQIPDGGTLADVICACIVDAYEDDQAG